MVGLHGLEGFGLEFNCRALHGRLYGDRLRPPLRINDGQAHCAKLSIP